MVSGGCERWPLHSARSTFRVRGQERKFSGCLRSCCGDDHVAISSSQSRVSSKGEHEMIWAAPPPQRLESRRRVLRPWWWS